MTIYECTRGTESLFMRSVQNIRKRVKKKHYRTEMASNQFANDGSFMELFRKRMEEQQKAKEATDTAQTITDPLDSQQKGQESRTKSRTTETKTEGDTRESEKREEESPAGPKSTPYQVVNRSGSPIPVSDTGTRAIRVAAFA